jgi:hypothetical protein
MAACEHGMFKKVRACVNLQDARFGWEVFGRMARASHRMEVTAQPFFHDFDKDCKENDDKPQRVS